MISNKSREIRRSRPSKISRNIERLYKEAKCVECSVVVTRMDFAKILGKFTKVKIQYESSSKSKSKDNTPNINSRLKNNENGMVLFHRKAYNQHPAKKSIRSRNNLALSQPASNNILKENNRLKHGPLLNGKNDVRNKNKNLSMKKYGIIFTSPSKNNNNDFKSKISLKDLLPHINKSILPSDNWHVTYLPNSEEPKDDMVYDRIAAELEDLMYNEKTVKKFENKSETVEQKIDEFPSIMDILNDNATEKQMKVDDQNESFKPNLESSDVEAMLLGKPDSGEKEPISMDVDNSIVGKLIEDVEQLNEIQGATCKESEAKVQETSDTGIDNPHSPSILDEALQKGIEEHLPPTSKLCTDTNKYVTQVKIDETPENAQQFETTENKKDVNENNTSQLKMDVITHVVFKKTENGKCYKTVTCPKNLKYSIELEGKSVELLGAPKYISSLEDLEVLLQIVNESELDRLYILH